MGKKILFVSNVAPFARHSHALIRWLRAQGNEVHYAANGQMPFDDCEKTFDIPIQRSPFSRQNIEAYRQLTRIMREESYDIVHCHTPMGGFLARLAARKYRRRGLRVLYTAHGFHFFKGAPLQNWLLYYTAEKLLAPVTDCLITINREDFSRAKAKLRTGRVEYVHGVGLDEKRCPLASEGEQSALREKFEIPENAYVLLFIGELKKNQQLLLRMLAQLRGEIPEALLLLAGDGPEQAQEEALAASLGVGGQVRFLGWRDDIRDLLACCDVYVSSSLREGLPINIMEAMAMERPIVATDIRGHDDLIESGKGGYLVSQEDAEGFARAVLALYRDPVLGGEMGRCARRALEPYLLPNVLDEMHKIYAGYL